MPDQTPSRQERIEAIFTAALERKDPAEREAYLAQACGDDADLRQEVSLALRGAERAGDFLGEVSLAKQITKAMPAPGNGDAAAGSPAQPAAGVHCGDILSDRYELFEIIGEGGFGTVFKARDLQFESTKSADADRSMLVAIKVLQAGMASRGVLARFEAEKQALAVLNHPNVARVFDAGRTRDGQPYFVMELVKGIAITKYCDKHRLTARERLALFTQVCAGVQHAHQKGIVHRDLKPENILVARYDEIAVPKVIDFGIAKAVGDQLVADPAQTNFYGIIGTVQYMSPEQATFNARDIDTRADVYGLGAVLYELLTGSPPLAEHLSRRRVDEVVLQLIREKEPLKPSTRLRSATTTAADGQTTASIAALRGTEPAAMSRQLRGDVDWIVMTALAKERERRYGSAADLARDIDRFLRNDPVKARPPTRLYLIGKFVRRHRVPVTAAAAVLLALIGGIVGTTWGYLNAEAAKSNERNARLQEQAARIQEQAARQDAEKRRLAAESASRRSLAYASLIRGSIALGDPFRISGTPPTMASVAEELATVLETSKSVPDDVRGPFFTFVARGLVGGVDASKSVDYASRGLQLTRSAIGPETPEALDALLTLAMSQFVTNNIAAAKTTLNEAEELIGRYPALPQQSEATDVPAALAMMRWSIAVAEKNMPAAEKHAAELVAATIAADGQVSPALIRARWLQTLTQVQNGRSKEGKAASAANLADAVRVLGPDHGTTLLCELVDIAIGADSEDLAAAEPKLAALLPRMERGYGPNHAFTALTCSLYGLTLRAANKTEEAEKQFARARQIAEPYGKSPRFGIDYIMAQMAAATGDRDAFRDLWVKIDQATPSKVANFSSQRYILAVFMAMPQLQKNNVPGALRVLEPLAAAELPPLDQLNDSQFTAVMMYRFVLWTAWSRDNKKQEADAASQKWLDEGRRLFATNPQRMVSVIATRWAVLFIGQDRYHASVEMLDAEIVNKPELRDLPQVRPAYAFMRGLSLAAVERFAEAEPLILEAINSSAKNPAATLFGNARPVLGGALAICRRARGDEAGFEDAVRLYGVDRSQMPAPPATRPTTAPAGTRPSTAPATKPAESWRFE